MRRKPPAQPAQAKPTTRLSDVQPAAARGRHESGRRRERLAKTPHDRDGGGFRDLDAARSRPQPESVTDCGISRSSPNPRKASRYSPMARAVAMLARREHSREEIVRKLKDKGVEEEEARKVADELAEMGLQSDQRFLESRIRQRVGGGYGPGRARQDLARQGLDEEAVAQAVDAPGQRWVQGAYDLIERRYGASPLPFEVRHKALGLLVRRGFSYEQAQQVIREPRPEPDEPADQD